MTPYGSGQIFTDQHGRPFQRPESPGANSTADDQVAFIRAVAAYNDAVWSAGSRAFNAAFSKALRQG